MSPRGEVSRVSSRSPSCGLGKGDGMKAAEVYESVTAQIIEQLERGDALGRWSAPWHGRHGVPRNASTSDAYRGGNVLAFWAAQIKNGYQTAYWATYRQ